MPKSALKTADKKPFVKLLQSSNLLVENIVSYNLTNLYPGERIYLVENFLTHEECDNIINQAKKELITVETDNEKITAFKDAWHEDSLSFAKKYFPNENKLIVQLQEKIESVTNFPIEQYECLQVARYEKNQSLFSHYDFLFDRGNPEQSFHQSGQRLVTFSTYLSDVEEGGETYFDFLDLHVKPKKGAALFFFQTLEDGKTLNLNMKHCGKSVVKGEKWLAIQWIREKKYSCAEKHKKCIVEL